MLTHEQRDLSNTIYFANAATNGIFSKLKSVQECRLPKTTRYRFPELFQNSFVDKCLPAAHKIIDDYGVDYDEAFLLAWFRVLKEKREVK